MMLHAVHGARARPGRGPISRYLGIPQCVYYSCKFGIATVPLCNSKFRDFGSLILGKYCTFVCGPLF